jgi:hypothetical protein
MIPIFHITHLENLATIIEDGCLWSDRRMLEREPTVTIGFGHIKQRRLDIAVGCHSGTKVGDYVPFYFCPRSVMLFVIFRRHHELQYRGGQREIVHLVSTVEAAIAAGDGPWAYSDGNAGTYYTNFYNDLEHMNDVLDWRAINAMDWRDPAIKEKKQAEFLVHDHFPWECFEEVGVIDEDIGKRVAELLAGSAHQLAIRAHRDWYYY